MAGISINTKGVYGESWSKFISAFFMFKDLAKDIIKLAAYNRRPFVFQSGSNPGDKFGIRIKFIKFGKVLSINCFSSYFFNVFESMFN